jgi:hypothetical protein
MNAGLEADRLEETDRTAIRARMREVRRSWEPGGPRDAAIEAETLARVGLGAIGCGPYDMRAVELEWVYTAAREELEFDDNDAYPYSCVTNDGRRACPICDAAVDPAAYAAHFQRQHPEDDVADGFRHSEMFNPEWTPDADREETPPFLEVEGFARWRAEQLVKYRDGVVVIVDYHS